MFAADGRRSVFGRIVAGTHLGGPVSMRRALFSLASYFGDLRELRGTDARSLGIPRSVGVFCEVVKSGRTAQLLFGQVRPRMLSCALTRLRHPLEHDPN